MNKRRIILSWLSVSVLCLLCGVLGLLQYKWIGEASVAEKERLTRGLEVSLTRLSQDFNSELTAACADLLPTDTNIDTADPGGDLLARYEEWKKTTHHSGIFSEVGIATPNNSTMMLRTLRPEKGTLEGEDWPAQWMAVKARLEDAAFSQPGRNRNPAVSFLLGDGLEIEVPLLRTIPRRAASPPGQFPGPPPPFPGRVAWMIFDVNLPYLRSVVLPELLQQHLSSEGGLDYQVEVITRGDPPAIIFQSHPNQGEIRSTADASVNLFGLQYDKLFPRFWPARKAAAEGWRPLEDPGAERRRN